MDFLIAASTSSSVRARWPMFQRFSTAAVRPALRSGIRSDRERAEVAYPAVGLNPTLPCERLGRATWPDGPS
jgi:hypothetical protein